ncbi:hypothetical protein Q7P37_009861 [Cladosporium fusiforme]
MADDPAPARDSIATSEDFRRIARAAGIELKQILQNDWQRATRYVGFLEFELKPYEDILKKVMDRFREIEFQSVHGGGDFDWRPIRLITHDASLDKDKTNEIPRDLWALPLLVGENNTVGQPLPVHKMIEVGQGDILLGYRTRE